MCTTKHFLHTPYACFPKMWLKIIRTSHQITSEYLLKIMFFNRDITFQHLINNLWSEWCCSNDPWVVYAMYILFTCVLTAIDYQKWVSHSPQSVIKTYVTLTQVGCHAQVCLLRCTCYTGIIEEEEEKWWQIFWLQ